jgi:integrase
MSRPDLTPEQRHDLAARHSWARPTTDAAGEDLRTPEELLEAMLRNFSVSSRGPYRTTVEEFFWYMRNLQPQTPVLETHPGQIADWEAFLKAPAPYPGNSDSTVRTKRSQVSAFFRYCIEQRRVPQNPIVRLPGRRQVRRGTPSTDPILLPAQIDAMLEEARRESYRSQVVVGTLIGMGLRRAELRDAQVEYVRQAADGWTLTISRKNDPEEDGKKIEAEMQTLDIPRGLEPILIPYLSGRPATGPLIPGGWSSRPNYETPLTVDGISDIIERIARRAGVEFHVYAHLCRATSITLSLTDPNASRERVAAYYGHSDTNTLRVYDHHPFLPHTGHITHDVILNWETQKGTNVTLAA